MKLGTKSATALNAHATDKRPFAQPFTGHEVATTYTQRCERRSTYATLTYHATDVARTRRTPYPGDEHPYIITTLNTGGWYTPTTKNRLNAWLQVWHNTHNIRIHVFQDKNRWYLNVTTPRDTGYIAFNDDIAIEEDDRRITVTNRHTEIGIDK